VRADLAQGGDLPGTDVRILIRKPPVTFAARPGITYRPVTDVSPSQVCVAWPPANDTNPVVQDFVECCLANKP
jgi:hypothetical protein